MRTVVTGGSGFIGGRLVARLLEAGHDVVILDREPSATFPDLVRRGDVRRPSDLFDALEGADVVYHLAAEHTDHVDPPSLYHEVNVEGTANLVRAAEAHGVERMIFTSTSAVYGLGEDEPDEETPPAPFNEYGRSKLEAERVLSDWAERGSRRLLIVRPCAVFGPGSKGNVARLIDAIARNRFVMVGRGQNRKSLCYVENLAAFLAEAAEWEAPFTVINYADKPDLTMEELVRLIRAETNGRSFLPRVPSGLALFGGHLLDRVRAAFGDGASSLGSGQVRKFRATTTLCARRLEESGFQPPCGLREALAATIGQVAGVE